MRADSSGRSGRRGGAGRRAALPRRPGESPRPAAKAGQPFIVLTGLSGSGKSQAIRALEDLGYFCVDNLPTTLIPTLARLSLRGDIEKVAIVVDVREGSFLSSFPADLPAAAQDARAEPGADLPRGEQRGAGAPLQRDAAAASAGAGAFGRRRASGTSAPGMNAIREMADEIIDTSDMTVHELRQFFMGLSRDRGRGRLVITLLSFGYKHGVPLDADLVFDVRCLPNPHFVPGAARADRPGSGGRRVHGARRRRRASSSTRLEDYLRFVVPHYVAEGKSYLTDRHRLHRRPPPLGDDRRAAETVPHRHRRHAGAREAPGHCRIRIMRFQTI